MSPVRQLSQEDQLHHQANRVNQGDQAIQCFRCSQAHQANLLVPLIRESPEFHQIQEFHLNQLHLLNLVVL